MAESSSEDSTPIEQNWIYYRNREEWKDIKPVPQDDGPFSVVKIAYSDKFTDVFDYLRAVTLKDERSARAFELTTDAIALNPANYTVWHFRRVLLQALNKDLRKELAYAQEIIEDNPKNYQVWHHRKIVVEWLRDPTREKKFTEIIFGMDAKNYHAWQYRQWLLQEFDLWEGELEFVNRLLEDDVRNNSAWNQRFFVISHTVQYTDDVLESEIRYALESIKKVPHNESVWNYLTGILHDKGTETFPNVIETCSNMYKENCRSPFLLGFMVTYLEEKLRAGEIVPNLQNALSLCEDLATKHDTIRKEYWNFVARTLGQNYGDAMAHSH